MPVKVYKFQDDGELVDDTLIDDSTPKEEETTTIVPITAVVDSETAESGEENEPAVLDENIADEELNEEEQEAWDTEMQRLHNYNLYCGSLHLLFGLFFMSYAWTNEDAKGMLMPVTSVFTNWDKGYPVQKKERMFQYNFVAATSCFSLMSAAAHFLVLLNWEKYEKDLKGGMNRFRWVEYAFSSSWILVLLMNLWGHFDWVESLGIFVINAMMCMFGDLHEVMNSGRKPADVNWWAYHYGGLMGLVPWAVLWAGIFRTPNKEEFPWYAWAYVWGY